MRTVHRGKERRGEASLKPILIIQLRDLDQGDNCAKKGLDSADVLKMGPMRLANRLHMLSDRKREVKGDPRRFGLNKWNTGFHALRRERPLERWVWVEHSKSQPWQCNTLAK